MVARRQHTSRKHVRRFCWGVLRPATLNAHQETGDGHAVRPMCRRGIHQGRAGPDRLGRQLWRCRACARRLTTRSASAFSGYRFPDEILALAVRWYLRFRLS